MSGWSDLRWLEGDGTLLLHSPLALCLTQLAEPQLRLSSALCSSCAHTMTVPRKGRVVTGLTWNSRLLTCAVWRSRHSLPRLFSLPLDGCSLVFLSCQSSDASFSIFSLSRRPGFLLHCEQRNNQKRTGMSAHGHIACVWCSWALLRKSLAGPQPPLSTQSGGECSSLLLLAAMTSPSSVNHAHQYVMTAHLSHLNNRCLDSSVISSSCPFLSFPLGKLPEARVCILSCLPLSSS